MKLDVPIKEIQSGIDISALKAAVLLATEDEWERNQLRQGRKRGAEEVETIILRMKGDDLPSGFHPAKSTTWDVEWDKWWPLIEPVVSHATKNYEGYERIFINKLLIPRLRPNMVIPEHTDGMPSVPFSHRIHVPLLTNPDVSFCIEGIRYPMEEGNAYEFDNTLMHSVTNTGDAPRIHLLFDIYIPKEES